MLKWGFLWIFWQFQPAGHISRANCAETDWDRHGKAVNEIFSIERRFWRSESRFFRFKETCTWGHQRAVPPVKIIILLLLASLLWKRLQIGMGMLPITASTSDELFRCINIDDFERFWVSKIRGFYWFLRSSAAAYTPRMNCDKMAGVRLTLCEQELL